MVDMSESAMQFSSTKLEIQKGLKVDIINCVLQVRTSIL